MDSRLGTWLLDLHRDSRSLPSDAFCDRVFARLSNPVLFDSGFLYRGAIRDNVIEFHAYRLFNQPPELLVRYVSEELWKLDPFIEPVLSRPGKASCYSIEECAPRFQAFLESNEQRQLLSLAVPTVELQLVAGFSLYRRDINKPFTDEDCERCEILVPHIVDAWTACWLAELVRSKEEVEAPFTLAVLTADRTLTAAQQDFFELMIMSWPNWRGPMMPSELVTYLAGRNDSPQAAPGRPELPFRGKGSVIYAQSISAGRTVLRIRRRHAFDGLPPRHRQVAYIYATGASQKDVAKRLNLSPKAVSNYLVDVYRTCLITDKTELALLMTKLQPGFGEALQS